VFLIVLNTALMPSRRRPIWLLAAKIRFDEAERLLLESYNTLKVSQGANNPRIRLALDRLVSLYDAWKKPEQSASYRNVLSSS
jgi:hypothetical protein